MIHCRWIVSTLQAKITKPFTLNLFIKLAILYYVLLWTTITFESIKKRNRTIPVHKGAVELQFPSRHLMFDDPINLKPESHENFARSP